MRRFRRFGIGFFAVALLALVYMRLMWPNSVLDAPEIVSAYAAKDVCSCVFVDGLEEGRCRANARQILPASIEVDHDRKSVRARSLWAVTRARWIDERHGCAYD